jgi:NAD(P)-dependent dehydrogenase (short-subunit alcohol dehydrogenase family)
MVFFVTGGSRGIGAAIVLDAIRTGHDVAFTYLHRREQALEVVEQARRLRPEGTCRAYQLDVRDSAAVEKVGDQVLDEFETVHAVVANAGVNVNNLAVSMSDEEWRTVIDTNLTGAFYVCRQFLPTFLGTGFGRIILISSIGAHGVSGQANYAASKAGLLGLSAALAKEYGRKSITSNVVVAGFFDTDMTREGMSEANRSFWLKYCPVGRVGELGEVSKAVLFLASDAASFINGQTLGVTGGLDWAP